MILPLTFRKFPCKSENSHKKRLSKAILAFLGEDSAIFGIDSSQRRRLLGNMGLRQPGERRGRAHTISEGARSGVGKKAKKYIE
jgi:hypothetical protein